MSDIAERKTQHLDIVMNDPRAQMQRGTGLDAVVFAHTCVPELDFDTIDLETTFLGRRLSAPLLISSMTGGPTASGPINEHLAAAAGHHGIAMGVGSQRIAVETGPSAGFSRRLRDLAGASPLYANFGAAQLLLWPDLSPAQRAVDMIAADALIVHFNPLQEAVQPGGDRNWIGILQKLAALRRTIDIPLIAKEVGAGISGTDAQRLIDAGVDAIDVAGAGGTSWAAVEGARLKDANAQAVALAFRDWGLPTADALREVRSACPDVPLIGSGGIRDGIDVARAIRLGANVVGQAAGVLGAAVRGPEDVIAHFDAMIATLRTVCFCTGSPNIAALQHAPLIAGPQSSGRTLPT